MQGDNRDQSYTIRGVKDFEHDNFRLAIQLASYTTKLFLKDVTQNQGNCGKYIDNMKFR